MARTRKTSEQKLSELEAEKAKIQARVESMKSKIAKLDVSIKDLKEGQTQKELGALLDAIKASGKAPEEIIAALKQQ